MEKWFEFWGDVGNRMMEALVAAGVPEEHKFDALTVVIIFLSLLAMAWVSETKERNARKL